MSIDRCTRCGRNVDTDVDADSYHKIKGETICAHWDCLTELEQKELENETNNNQ